MGVTRRQVLAASAAAALASAGGLAVTASRWWDRPAEAGFDFLSDDEAAVVEAWADCLFPPGGVPPLAGADAGLSGYFDAMLGGLPPPKATQLKLLLHALDSLALAETGTALTALPRAERWRLARGWLTSSIAELRGATVAFSTLLGCGYTTHPDAAEVFGTWYGCGYGR